MCVPECDMLVWAHSRGASVAAFRWHGMTLAGRPKLLGCCARWLCAGHGMRPHEVLWTGSLIHGLCTVQSTLRSTRVCRWSQRPHARAIGKSRCSTPPSQAPGGFLAEGLRGSCVVGFFRTICECIGQHCKLGTGKKEKKKAFGRVWPGGVFGAPPQKSSLTRFWRFAMVKRQKAENSDTLGVLML